MQSWREVLSILLHKVVPYAFVGKDGQKPFLNKDEAPEIFSQVADEVEGMMKKAFILGFMAQPEWRDVVGKGDKKVGERVDFVFSEENGSYYTDRAWEKAKETLG